MQDTALRSKIRSRLRAAEDVALADALVHAPDEPTRRRAHERAAKLVERIRNDLLFDLKLADRQSA